MIELPKLRVTRERMHNASGMVTFRCEYTFVHHEQVSDALLADPASEQAMTERVEFQARKAVWAHLYGELLTPFADLVYVAKHCPNNYQEKATRAAMAIGTLLVQPPPPTTRQ